MPEHPHNPAGEQPGKNLPKQPHELPHGLLKPPQAVLDALAKEKTKFPPEVFAHEVEERTLNEWTVDYVFGHQLGYYDDVLYRPTPEGPEVIAVGTVEVLDRTKNMLAEEQDLLKTWTLS
jgi:hypothetical protein